MHIRKSTRPLGTFTVGMLSLAVVISLRNLPLTAKHGLSMIFFYALAVSFFMIPYALISAELASYKPQGIYVWARDALGRGWGFFSIWMQWFHNMTWYPAMLAFIASTSVYKLNPELAHNKVYLAAIILIGFWVLTFFNFLGISSSALFSSICVIIGTLIPGAILVALAGAWILKGNPIAIQFSWSELIPNFCDSSSFVMLAGLLLALCGLEANANLAADIENPKKNYPKAVLIGGISTLLILVLGSLSIAIVIPREEISLVSGLIQSFILFFNKYNLGWMTGIIAVMIIAGSLGELNAWMLAGTKGLFTSTQNDCLPALFKKVNKKNVPTNLMIFQGIVVTLFTLIVLCINSTDLAYWILSALSVQMYLAMYICLFISGPILRIKEPNAKRMYIVPGGKYFGIIALAVLGIIACLFALFMSFLPPKELLLASTHKISYSAFLLLAFAVNSLIPFGIYFSQKNR